MRATLLFAAALAAAGCGGAVRRDPARAPASPVARVVAAPTLPIDTPSDEAPVLAVDQDPPHFALAARPLTQIAGRPRLERPLRVETPLASIPNLSSEDDEELGAGRFDLTLTEGGYRLVLGSDLLAEVEVDGTFRAYTWSKLGAPPSLALARRSDGYQLGTERSAPYRAVVRGFHMGDWSEDTLHWVEYDARYDPSTRRGAARTRRRSEARALWPGVVYAFVADEAVSGARKLVVLAPPTSWLTSAPQSPSDELRPHVGSFSWVAVSLDGPTAAVSLSFTDEELGTFLALRSGRGRARVASRADAPAREPSATVRVLVDVENDVDGGIVRTIIEPLAPSPVVDTALAFAAHREADAAAERERRSAQTIGISRAPTPRPSSRRLRGCSCEPNDPLCPCYD